MERGLGTTHVALTLANYVCSKLGMKTAYIELNTTNQIHTLSRKKGKPYFVYKGITFYSSINVTSLSEILHMDYQVFVLDIGILNTYNIREFLRCDKPFLICSPGKWRCSQIKEKLEKTFHNLSCQHCTVIMNLCEEESNLPKLLLSCKHLPFPFISNPFRLDTCCFRAMKQILNF